MQYSYVLCILLCAYCHNLQCDNVDNLSYGLKSIAIQILKKKKISPEKLKQEQELKEQIQKQLELQKQQDLLQKQEDAKLKQEHLKQENNLAEGLLGPWMVKNRPNDIIASDKNKHIYQIKVLKQWEGDCWVHSFRNILYFFDLINAPRKDFDDIYKNMVAREGYKAFTQYGCPLLGTVTRTLLEEQLSCRPTCIPQQSPEYLHNILTFSYEPKFSTELMKETQKLLEKLENRSISTQAAYEYLLVAQKFNIQSTNFARFLEIFYKMRNNKNYTIGFNLACGAINHGTTLVVHKYNDVVEYLFADSNNVSFTGNNKKTINEKRETIYYVMTDTEYDLWKNTFTAEINQIISYIENQKSLDETLIRTLYKAIIDDYNDQKKFNIEQFGKENWKELGDFSAKLLEELYTKLKKYGLLKSDMYTSTYKKIYCDFITTEQHNHSDKKYHNALLKKISC